MCFNYSLQLKLHCIVKFDPTFSPFAARLLQATVGGLHMTQPASIRISAVRAVFGFCDHLKMANNTQLLAPFLQNILEGLIGIATQFSADVMGLCLETLSVVITVSSCFKFLFWKALNKL